MSSTELSPAFLTAATPQPSICLNPLSTFIKEANLVFCSALSGTSYALSSRILILSVWGLRLRRPELLFAAEYIGTGGLRLNCALPNIEKIF